MPTKSAPPIRVPQLDEMQLSQLRLRNYRQFKDLELSLRPLNVLVGVNGVGKSTVLDALLLLAEASEGRLTKALTKRGGVDSLRRRHANAEDSIGLEISVEVGRDSPMLYHLDFGQSGSWFQIRKEWFSPFRKAGAAKPYLFVERDSTGARLYDGGKLIPPDWDIQPGETLVGQARSVPKDIDRFRNFLGSYGYFGPLDVKANAVVRAAQPLDPTILFPGAEGDGLVSCLYNLKHVHTAVYDRIEAAVRAAFPGFAGFEFPLTGLGNAMLQWKEDSGAKFLASELSEGTLRYVWLTVALLSPQKPRLLLLDEPEVSLHPKLLMLLAGLLQEAAIASVVIVATHADQLVRWLEPDELVFLDHDEHCGVRLHRGSDADVGIADWLKEYRLDELWLQGHVGGKQ